MNDEPRELVEQCLAGDQSAMTALAQRFQGAVFGLCYRMLGNRQDAEDVAQESLTRLFRSLASWDSERPFEPWLLAIAGNRCRTALGARKRRASAASLDESFAEPVAAMDEHSADPLSEEVDLALSLVRDEYRQAFLYFHQHEMSYAEIAEAMDCPLGTVKTWVHRARQELIERLRQREVIEEPRYAVRRV